jgi:hypothetical protein
MRRSRRTWTKLAWVGKACADVDARLVLSAGLRVLLAGFVNRRLAPPRFVWISTWTLAYRFENILLIDLPYLSNDNNNDPTEYRVRLADLLGVMAASERERPQAVILDIWISNDSRGLAELTEAIKRLRERPTGPVDVYAVFNPQAEGKEGAEQLWKEHAQDLYRSVLTGYGHTELDLSMGVLSYEPELQIPATAGTTELMWALPARVAMDLGRRGAAPPGVPWCCRSAAKRRWVADHCIHACRAAHPADGFASRATAPAAEVRQEDSGDRKPHRGSLPSISGRPGLDGMGTERSIEELQLVEATTEQSRRGVRPDRVLRLIHGVRVRAVVQIRYAPANQASADGLAVHRHQRRDAGIGRVSHTRAQLRHAGRAHRVLELIPA